MEPQVSNIPHTLSKREKWHRELVQRKHETNFLQSWQMTGSKIWGNGSSYCLRNSHQALLFVKLLGDK